MAARKTGVEPRCVDCFVEPNFEPRMNDIVRYSKAARRNNIGDDDIHQIVGFEDHLCSPSFVILENGDQVGHGWLVLLGGATEAFEEAARLRKEIAALKGKSRQKKAVRRKRQ